MHKIVNLWGSGRTALSFMEAKWHGCDTAWPGNYDSDDSKPQSLSPNSVSSALQARVAVL